MRTKPKPNAATYGIDIGKKVFHVVALDADGRPVQRVKFSRETLLRFGHDDAKFGQMRPDRVHQLSALADEEVPRLVVQQGRLPLGRLHRRRAEGTPAA